jgi:ribonuclease P protein component
LARFKRRARLLKPADFDRVFQSGQRDVTAHYTAVTSPNDQGRARLGLALSRKQVPLAVDRNRLKRQLRASFREAQARLPACDIVVMTRSQARLQPRAVLAAELDKLWSRIARRWSDYSSSASTPTSG